MSESKGTSKSKMAIWVAVITGLFTLCGVIITAIVGPIILQSLQSSPTPTQFIAAATPNTPTAAPILPTNTRAQPSFTSTPKLPTNTPVPEPTYTPLKPTDTPRPSPTDTPRPVTTPIPSLSLPFQDNFDNGIRPEWRVLSGQPVVVDGRLGAATDEVALEIGDSSLSNYVVELDFAGLDGLDLIMGRNIRYNTYHSENRWEAFQDNKWVYIGRGTPRGRTGHMRLIVQGNSYSVYRNGEALDQLSYGLPVGGPFGIRIDKAVFIDNLSITNP